MRTITGVIYLEGEGEAIGATIVVEGDEEFKTTTEYDGTFSFGVPQCTKALEISYTGFHSQIVSIKNSDYIQTTLLSGELVFETVPYVMFKVENNAGCSPTIDGKEISNSLSESIIIQEININSNKDSEKQKKKKSKKISNIFSDLKISIPTNQNLLFQKPSNKKDFFEIYFDVVLHNTGKENIRIIDPIAYRVFPHSWLVKKNKKAKPIWNGDFACASAFETYNIIELCSGDSIKFVLNLHESDGILPKRKGNHQLSLKYSYHQESNRIISYPDIEYDITDIETAWSNEVRFTIE